MELCLIPPKGMYNRALEGTTQMVLAHLLGDLVYLNVSLEAKRWDPKVFTIMDNGAAEGKAVDINKLDRLAFQCSADEMILPDFLDDAVLTYQASKKYLYEAQHIYFAGRYQVVIHGISLEHAKSQIERYSKIPEVNTIGLPRSMMKRIGLSIRLDLADWIRQTYPDRFQVHFLGMSPNWVREPFYAEKYHPGAVRSIDTSAPFNYALQGVMFPLDGGGKAIHRPEGYFETEHAVISRTTLDYNIRVMRAWCNGK